ncbi:hypothetical protein [Burkholderia pyrrocinia]|uniref:hypothetical protein n=1 Tax=Burkholderia pyrrocinia TaxID=60550 RepID=UPI000B091372|nr:hypothetical protein [Burkholderia pyrrocinia]
MRIPETAYGIVARLRDLGGGDAVAVLAPFSSAPFSFCLGCFPGRRLDRAFDFWNVTRMGYTSTLL